MRALDKVIGYNHIKKELYRIIDILNNSDKYAEVGVKIPKGIMLAGNPGIGKSLMAQCVMEECNRTSYIIRKDKPDGVFVDYIRDTFVEAAKNAPSIILLDDLDKFANASRFRSDAEEYVTVQACIDSVKNENVFVIATVNEYDLLPDSLTRKGRFDFTFSMKFPKGEDAKKIIEFYLKDKKCDDNIDAEEIARYTRGYSCADLESIINQAGITAVFNDRKIIAQEDLRAACLQEVYGVTDEEEVPEDVVYKRVVHEAGHTVIAELCNPGCVSFASAARMNYDRVGGIVTRELPNGYMSRFEDIETEIKVKLAGKAAVEIVLGEIDTGSNQDLHGVFEKLNSILDAHTSYGFNTWDHGDETSERVHEHLDILMASEASRYYMLTKKMLIQNKAFLDAIIENLIEKKFLSYKDIAKIREKGGF